jgi:hypothetical protein
VTVVSGPARGQSLTTADSQVLRGAQRLKLNHHVSRIVRRSTPAGLANPESRLALSLRLVLLADALYESGTRGGLDELHKSDAERRVRNVMKLAFRGEARLVERQLAEVAALPPAVQQAFCEVLVVVGWRLFDGPSQRPAPGRPVICDARPVNGGNGHPTPDGKGRAILRHGPATYSVSGHSPLTVTTLEDQVLRAFLAAPELDPAALKQRSGVARPADVLTRLRRKYGGIFAPAIVTPGRRRGGLYQVTIRTAG